MPELESLVDILSRLETVILRAGLVVLLIIGLFHVIRDHARRD